jgi:hypothetical protein
MYHAAWRAELVSKIEHSQVERGAGACNELPAVSVTAETWAPLNARADI